MCKEKKQKKKVKNTGMYKYSWMDSKWHEQAPWTHLKTKQNKTNKTLWLFSLYPIQFLTQELLHAVCVPLEYAEFFSNVPAVVQKL